MKKVVIYISILSLVCGCAWIKTRMMEKREEVVWEVTFTGKILLDKKPEEIFDFATTWKNIDEILPYVKFDLPPEPKIKEVGEQMSGQATLLGVHTIHRFVVTRLEQDRRMDAALAGEMRGSIKMILEPKGDKTLFSMETHIFMLPDTSLYNALTAALKQGRSEEIINERLSAVFMNGVAKIEGREVKDLPKPEEMSHSVFVDPYFSARQNFLKLPKDVFNMFTSVDAWNSYLEGVKIEPVGDSPRIFAPGGHYQLIAGEGYDSPVVYDLIIGRLDSPKECRMFLRSEEVFVEADILTAPTLKGTDVYMVFIVDLPEDVAGTSLNSIMFASGIDKTFQKALTKAKAGIRDQ